MSEMRPTTSGVTGRPTRASGQDRAQLHQHPVRLGRVLALFRPHAGTVAAVMGIIAAIALLGMAQPFLLREVIDQALAYDGATFGVDAWERPVPTAWRGDSTETQQPVTGPVSVGSMTTDPIVDVSAASA